jgi:hypothetical protein
MKQLNVNITPEFERDLRRLMKNAGIKRKSDAVRQAVHEAAARAKTPRNYDFRSLIGIALRGPESPDPRFKTEDDLGS